MLGNVHYFYVTVHCNSAILIELNFPHFELYSALMAFLHTCNCMVFNEITPGLGGRVHDSSISLLLQFASVQSIGS